MNDKLVVGSKIMIGKDVPDLMEWLEKRIGKRSKQPIDMAFLPLLVSEILILMLRENWMYNEDYDDAIVALRVFAKDMARSLAREFEGK